MSVLAISVQHPTKISSHGNYSWKLNKMKGSGISIPICRWHKFVNKNLKKSIKKTY